MKLDSMHNVTAAARILADQHGAAKDRLAQAGVCFWRALIDVDSWPRDLAEKAQQICRRFMENGTVELTVNAMDPHTAADRVEELAKSVASLLADIKLALQDGRLATPAVQK
jgi:hypothetical protein